MYTLAIAGSTERTAQVVTTLLQDSRFKISLVITPEPRAIGREQTVTKNPLQLWAEQNQLPIVLVDAKLDSQIQKQIEHHCQQTPIDFLLVVDFGYLVPKWLLELPKLAPLNIHPSKLPRWRGSSPGQFVLLNGETDSAVTLMVMNEALDEGPIVAQLAFKVEPTWTQIEYYQHSFNIICAGLADLIEKFAQGKLIARPQPTDSPTPVADRLSKKDSFRAWSAIQQAMTTGKEAQVLEQTCRAYYPWPKLWTLVPTPQGEKRLIIHRAHLDQAGHLALDQVQLEGKKITPWSEVKNTLTL
jgi:methionyl-tRNA formyltransferase